MRNIQGEQSTKSRRRRLKQDVIQTEGDNENKEEENPEPQTGSDPADERSPDFSHQNVGKTGVGSQGYEKYP